MNYKGYINLKDMDLQECYDSPLDIITQMANQIMADMENGVVKAVNNVGINIKHIRQLILKQEGPANIKLLTEALVNMKTVKEGR